jgi:hypothetical protein
MCLSAESTTRRALAAYNVARRRTKEIELDKPDPDESTNNHEGYNRLSQAAAIAERMARDDLYDAVVLFTGKAPSAVIVDSVGGSSIVALGNADSPEGMIVATAPDRVRIKDFVCRPEPPPEFAHEWRQIAPNQAGNYAVMQRGDVVAIYNGVYFKSTNAVLADFLELLHVGLEGMSSDDYGVWCDGQIMAVIHSSISHEEKELVIFSEPRNDPIAARELKPMPRWPTYEGWVEVGRGDLWSDRCDR